MESFLLYLLLPFLPQGARNLDSGYDVLEYLWFMLSAYTTLQSLTVMINEPSRLLACHLSNQISLTSW